VISVKPSNEGGVFMNRKERKALRILEHKRRADIKTAFILGRLSLPDDSTILGSGTAVLTDGR
jgi:hypothetical protein